MADAFTELLQDEGFLDGLNGLESADQAAVDSYFSSSEFKDYFSTMKVQGIECTELFYDTEDEAWKMTVNGKDVDLDAIKESWGNGDYKTVFNEMGFDMNNETTIATLSDLNDSFQATPKAAFDKVMQDLQAVIDKYSANGIDNSIANQADLEVAASKAGINIDSAGFDDAKNEIDPEDPTTWQKMQNWLEEKGGALMDFIKNNILTIAFIIGLAFLAKDLYDFIKSVQHAMSGCWSYMNGNKGCKIDALTCDDADLVNSNSIFGSGGQGFTICTACTTDPSCSSGGGDWIPALKGQICQCDTSGSHGYLAGYNPLATTGTNPCTGFNNPTCPVVAKKGSKSFRKAKLEKYNPTSTPTSYACPYASGCVARSEACQTTTNSDCSAWCDPSVTLTKTGQSLTCTQCDFSCAAAAVLGNLFPSGVLGDIEKVLLYIALGIVGLVILYIIGKGLLSWVGGSSDKQKVEIQLKTEK